MRSIQRAQFEPTIGHIRGLFVGEVRWSVVLGQWDAIVSLSPSCSLPLLDLIEHECGSFCSPTLIVLHQNEKMSAALNQTFQHRSFSNLSLSRRLSMLVLDLLTTLLPVELMTPTKSIKMEEEFRIAGCSSLLAGLPPQLQFGSTSDLVQRTSRTHTFSSI